VLRKLLEGQKIVGKDNVSCSVKRMMGLLLVSKNQIILYKNVLLPNFFSSGEILWYQVILYEMCRYQLK
jgi:hypothetical protein